MIARLIPFALAMSMVPIIADVSYADDTIDAARVQHSGHYLPERDQVATCVGIG
jgi:hypothetical protein